MKLVDCGDYRPSHCNGGLDDSNGLFSCETKHVHCVSPVNVNPIQELIRQTTDSQNMEL